eukprot:TRINITY_DN713_c0_g1_i1.p1 TRINITY_DN713_c0_g1~~TRINITY_DN713_c0_g1_i1.p1  ORF type:complete len:173 (-),score=52.21 TRINITY_DN713_c0_g1_i1:189-707(-)
MSFFVESDNGSLTAAGDYELYQVGEDYVNVQITTNYPSDELSVFGVELENVWICTFDPLDISSVSLEVNPDNLGGCFSTNPLPDAVDSNDYHTHIYDLEKATLYEDFALGAVTDNVINFKFLVPTKLVRDTLFIHAQIEVLLSSGQTIGRRLLMSAPKGVNQMDHFVNRIGS